MSFRPALGSLRAIAVVAVVLAHAYVPWLHGGGHGVHLFFALSGFLITTLLMAERERTGRVALGKFYGRRALRLFPALALLLAFTILLIGVGRADVGSVAATTLYAANWLSALTDHALGPLAHTWSLSVEEQFYLLWPLALLAVMPRLGAKGIVVVAVVGALASLGARFLVVDDGFDRILHGTDAAADYLLWGCALAAAVVAWPEAVKRGVKIAFWPSVAFLTWVFIWDLGPSELALTLGGTAVAVTCAVVVGRLGLFEDSLTRAVGWKPLVWIGGISYGMYLWHYPIEVLTPTAIQEHIYPFAALSLGLTVVAATISFHLVERPLQNRYRKRFEVSKRWKEPMSGEDGRRLPSMSRSGAHSEVAAPTPALPSSGR